MKYWPPGCAIHLVLSLNIVSSFGTRKQAGGAYPRRWTPFINWVSPCWTQRYSMAAISWQCASPLNLHRLTFACCGGTTASIARGERITPPNSVPSDLLVATLSGKECLAISGELDVALTISAPSQPTETHLASNYWPTHCCGRRCLSQLLPPIGHVKMRVRLARPAWFDRESAYGSLLALN